jgi:hypothetical protein
MMLLLSKIVKLSVVVVSVMAFTSILLGCSTGFKTIVPVPPEKYEKVGSAKGQGSGMLGVLGTSSYFIPIGLNSRVDTAYDEALKSVPGATALTDVTYQEDWYWLVIGTLRIVTITGEAIKEVKK